jgi:hypothetical protein
VWSFERVWSFEGSRVVKGLELFMVHIFEGCRVLKGCGVLKGLEL